MEIMKQFEPFIAPSLLSQLELQRKYITLTLTPLSFYFK